MGYTNYWTIKKSAKEQDYKNALKAIRKFLKFITDKENKVLLPTNEYFKGNFYLASYHIVNGAGDINTKPDMVDCIVFNGVNADGLDHESFFLHGTLKDLFNDTWSTNGFNFCKTARKPYDAAVVACMIILKRFLKNDIEISSDGIGLKKYIDCYIDIEILNGIKLYVDYCSKVIPNFNFTKQDLIDILLMFGDIQMDELSDDAKKELDNAIESDIIQIQ